jgi:hypothetical protein
MLGDEQQRQKTEPKAELQFPFPLDPLAAQTE